MLLLVVLEPVVVVEILAGLLVLLFRALLVTVVLAARGVVTLLGADARLLRARTGRLDDSIEGVLELLIEVVEENVKIALGLDVTATGDGDALGAGRDAFDRRVEDELEGECANRLSHRNNGGDCGLTAGDVADSTLEGGQGLDNLAVKVIILGLGGGNAALPLGNDRGRNHLIGEGLNDGRNLGTESLSRRSEVGSNRLVDLDATASILLVTHLF